MNEWINQFLFLFFFRGETKIEERRAGEDGLDDGNYSTPTRTPEDFVKNMRRLNIYRAAVEGNWEEAVKIFEADPDAKTMRVNGMRMTPLLVAANCGKSEFVVKLVEKVLEPDDLDMIDQLGRNALHHVALACDVRAAEAMVRKNRDLVERPEVYGYTPLFYAARWRLQSKGRAVLDYLYSQTPWAAIEDPETQSEKTRNLVVAITTSGAHGLNSVKITSKEIKMVMEEEKKHKDAMKLVEFICERLKTKSDAQIMDYFIPQNFPAVLNVATRSGIVELVETCLKNFPDLIWYSSDYDKKKLLIHVAVKHRQEKIFNCITTLTGQNAGAYANTVDEHYNNILHLAALLAPIPRLHSVPGPAFQMQRELQWFQAVEKIVYRDEIVARNKDHKTPQELFYEKHENLMKDAKEWIKDTSNSCMVVAALVATVAFASMITVPGGLDNGTGKPVLSNKGVFIIFSVSNAFSMISSAVALLMFLSLQTSRFTADDFLELLPKNLLQGLLALFIAVATMMLAFGTAIGIALQSRVSWAYIPITVVACFPAIIFTKLQLPLLYQTLGIARDSKGLLPK
ncbi:OLC1v1018472C3 [Oldenlandia corymbosa var. corymbosa]|uniref:OLC1v1018472C3 n=1 Tax=Oldenlandia corymbosa var. corymbosa TaxID=529605 RepID=A0AAV1EBN9_OLDCO|nr:OLC1v1018472C3 [Oldenlandia corymbosa var. corymbosa]